MRAIASKLKRKLKPTDKLERCGLILVDGTAVQVDNIHPQPERGFMMPAQVLIKHGDELAGTWHTHPGQSAVLSQEDYAGFSQWPQLTHYIVGTDGVRAYSVVDGIIQELDVAAD